ncbi:MAG TPA: AraC family transcriptional regulator [Clostridiales bacterium]|nr:AraC family transcriptional regulator [Clostridiales bacterium]
MHYGLVTDKSSTSSDVLYMHQVGWETCEPNHSFGPAVRDHYLIHCVLDGTGEFYVGKRRYQLKKGEGFLIVPGVVTFYQADAENPWRYCWLGFNGTEARNICSQCGISMDSPIFSFEDAARIEECIYDLRKCYSLGGSGFLLLSKLYEFFSMIYNKNKVHENRADIIGMAVDFIRKNYSYGITVQQTAEHLGVSRSHLFRLFKQNMGQSVQEYLLAFKLEQAEAMLKETNMSIKEVMYSCGFNDMPNFSRQFKKAYGKPPAAYRTEKR